MLDSLHGVSYVGLNNIDGAVSYEVHIRRRFSYVTYVVDGFVSFFIVPNGSIWRCSYRHLHQRVSLQHAIVLHGSHVVVDVEYLVPASALALDSLSAVLLLFSSNYYSLSL
jgi:hypothetical protein